MTVNSQEVKKILEENGFEVFQWESYENDTKSASQRLRFYFFFIHSSGIEAECWLRHNLEGHNDAPSNTHRLMISLGVNCESVFSKNFDFKGKDDGPSAKMLNDYIKRFSKALDAFIALK